ncbi:short-chain fatty acid transporter [Arcticibacterium luteifluviistationis]|uniref:Short-chain fatty acid transporter n=1 Tax=Arcticibacterium luteifluviistationis TaxID=1784714 RepID=A0A2Z4GBS9_9BACT|nr:TIGR00366 family protein [Arcticibacterium luteifluviistationis]AWV98656.1 short-chain fatty acid transporter [Arcticibacterium luteifluviistationis]
MISRLGEKFTDIFRKNMPDAFVFALVLTLITSITAFFWVGATPLKIIQSWYDGFWSMLAFGMQMVLLIITGYSIALSPFSSRAIDKVAKYISTPKQVYFITVVFGMLAGLVSWGWVVIAALLGRELALRVRGVNYAYLIACVYFSSISWVSGLSSSIPLLLNTEKNFLIEAGILDNILPTSLTLGSTINMCMIALFVLLGPFLMLWLAPKKEKGIEIIDELGKEEQTLNKSISQEAEDLKLPEKSFSDFMNNTSIFQYIIVFMGFSYVIYHFYSKGLDLNLNIMIFFFIMIGMLLHKTPMRYSISMKRSSTNISSILYQYPFYAGIMGIMTYSGLGDALGQAIANIATIDNYPFYAYVLGGIVNFAIPSGGGEFAVIGPSIIEAVNQIGAGLPDARLTEMTARASLSLAYGEALTNLLQPFFLLIVVPIMGAGLKIQARDVMGYLAIPFLIYFVLQILMVLYLPI